MANEPNDRVCTCPDGVTGMDVNCERCGLPTVIAAPATQGPGLSDDEWIRKQAATEDGSFVGAGSPSCKGESAAYVATCTVCGAAIIPGGKCASCEERAEAVEACKVCGVTDCVIDHPQFNITQHRPVNMRTKDDTPGCEHGYPEVISCDVCNEEPEPEQGEQREPYASLSWALDLLDMYDQVLIELGEPKDKVYSPVHLRAKKRAHTVLAELSKLSTTAPTELPPLMREINETDRAYAAEWIEMASMSEDNVRQWLEQISCRTRQLLAALRENQQLREEVQGRKDQISDLQELLEKSEQQLAQIKAYRGERPKVYFHYEQPQRCFSSTEVDPILDKHAQSQAAYEWLLQDKNNVIAAQALEIAALKLQLSDSDLVFNHANEVVGKLEQDNAQKDKRIAELEGGK